MPRRSTAALTTVTPLGTPPRLVPPADMAEDAKQVFIDTVHAASAAESRANNRCRRDPTPA
jgi:hypothetical protein